MRKIKWVRKRGEVKDPKPCQKCRRVLALAKFWGCSASSDGHTTECGECLSKRAKERYEKLRNDKSRCWCGRPSGVKTRHCESCRASANASTKRIRESRIAKGLCQQCGGPAAPYTFCESCESKKHEKIHGGTLEARKALFEAQKGICPLCMEPLIHYMRQKHAVVDHDHETGKIRGLLHDRCNRRIGDIDLETAKRLVAYLS